MLSKYIAKHRYLQGSSIVHGRAALTSLQNLFLTKSLSDQLKHVPPKVDQLHTKQAVSPFLKPFRCFPVVYTCHSQTFVLYAPKLRTAVDLRNIDTLV